MIESLARYIYPQTMARIDRGARKIRSQTASCSTLQMGLRVKTSSSTEKSFFAGRASFHEADFHPDCARLGRFRSGIRLARLDSRRVANVSSFTCANRVGYLRARYPSLQLQRATKAASGVIGAHALWKVKTSPYLRSQRIAPQRERMPFGVCTQLDAFRPNSPTACMWRYSASVIKRSPNFAASPVVLEVGGFFLRARRAVCR